MSLPRSGDGYRPDIDGLRGVAVTAVVLHHLGLAWPAAGFAGVDVFFVISGFLIGGILLREQAAGSFTYRRFYARRARRILPALLVMMALTLPFAWAWMYPHQLRYFGGAVISTLTFLSNVWFWQRIDYFNPEAALDPLVHTWSLGVEEQFYILLPLVIGGLWRFGLHRLYAGLLALAVASLWLMLARGTTAPSEVFYLIHARAWELLAGVGAAAVRPLVLHWPARLRASLASAGLAVLLACLTVFPDEAGWPGAWTLPVVLASVALVLCGDAASPARWALIRRVPLGLGVISYSLYLWHQPVIAGFRLKGVALDTGPMIVLAIALCLALAAASWRFVEEPFRRGPVLPRPGRWALGGLAAGLAAFAIGGHVTEGYPARLPEAAQVAISYEHSYAPSYGRCALDNDDVGSYSPAEACIHGAAVPPDFAIWGDSHAAVLSETLGTALGRQGASIAEFTVGGCPPILGVKKLVLKTGRSAAGADYCDRFNRIVLDHLLAHPSVRAVLLNAYWTDYVSTDAFDSRAGWIWPDPFVSVPLEADGLPARDQRLAALDAGLEEIVAALEQAGKTVVVMAPLPMAGLDVPQAYANRLWQDADTPADLAYPTAAFDAFAAETRAFLAHLAARHPKLVLLDLSAGLCAARTGCQIVKDRIPLYSDFGHLSLPGVARVVPDLAAGLLAARSP